ncbi:MAG: N-acetylneuraminate synthase family protein [Bacteroidota bacterium]
MQATHATPALPQFIFEMANNHQGDPAHGRAIIAAMAKIAREFGIPTAVKLQYRDLDTFIRPDFRGRMDVRHVKRFADTRLSWADFQGLVAAIKDAGLQAVVTPFDEPSVDKCLDHGVDVLKVASCSATDWPLLERVAKAGKPVIVSTGGLGVADVDRVVTFFEHRDVADLAMMHCVSLYPTPNERQNLNFMRRMMRRYPHVRIGYSGHEAPDNLAPGRAAAAMGAKLLERHVGVPTDEITLNTYSMDPDQTRRWVEAVLDTIVLLGPEEGDKPVTEEELAALRALRRSVFATRPISEGEKLTADDVFFAFPAQEGEMTTSEWRSGHVAGHDVEPEAPLLDSRPYDTVAHMRSVVHEAKGLLREAGIAIGTDYSIELSHHYGMDKFRRYGAVIVNLFNREYCKKLIILLAGQYHPSHQHRQKEETFQVLHGGMTLKLDGEQIEMHPGDMRLIHRGRFHAFTTKTGVIFEEISTTHVKGDSFYEDEAIASLDPMQRKTVIENW